jgi:hypothetical protein
MNDCAELFKQTYPGIDFDMLVKQPDTILTNDASTHYLYGGQLYSYNWHKKEWYQATPFIQSSLRRTLFPNVKSASVCSFQEGETILTLNGI